MPGSREVARPLARTVRAKLLVDEAHYADLIAGGVSGARVSVWIATANLKTMLVEAPIGSRARARGRYVSFFETLRDLSQRGVEIRVLHASPPSGPLAREMDRLLPRGAPRRARGGELELRRCPRVHLKMIAIDGRLLYLGSANLTGAGLGAKGADRRNFEMGIVTDDEAMLDATQERFDRIWSGAECGRCKLRRQCDAPLDGVRRLAPRPLRKTTSGTKSAGPATPAATAGITAPASSPRARRSLSVLG